MTTTQVPNDEELRFVHYVQGANRPTMIVIEVKPHTERFTASLFMRIVSEKPGPVKIGLLDLGRFEKWLASILPAITQAYEKELSKPQPEPASAPPQQGLPGLNLSQADILRLLQATPEEIDDAGRPF